MATQNISKLTGTVAPGLEKGVISKGEVIRITVADAQDIMTPEQVIARKVRPEMKFVEMEIIELETKTIFNKSFRYYEGSVPENSVQGQILSMYGDIEENSVINLITREAGRESNKFVVWDVITG